MPGAVPGCGKTWWVKGANRSEKKQNCFSHLRLKWKKGRWVGQVMCLQISEIHIGAPWKLLSEFSLTFR
ncbi:hypothetical protein P5673_013299 [Acropora cervicornis]|uniref:Uncharacterized protein n=1 Tax=Acropora cervicornis TaxID=6130 RepID=A0AAD9QMA8_ACRCE|nr:hypothetical protein P5673_013299 [Acropora cervicornis]